MKGSIFTEELSAFDKKVIDFWNENISLNDYLEDLIRIAKEKKLVVGQDIVLLSEMNDIGIKIDFERAKEERDEAICALKNRLSEREQKELIKKY